jgi:hypothetical protein
VAKGGFMIKLLLSFWQILVFIWKYVKPIIADTRHIFDEIKEKGLTDEAARKHAFQDITDLLQEKGFKDTPDSVLNCTLELCYQIYLWENAKKEANGKT